MGKETIQLVVDFDIHELDTFLSVAQACSDYVATNEAGTLNYDWYITPDNKSGKLLETYENQQALKTHLLGPVFTEIGTQFKRSIRWQAFQSFGELPPLFHELLGAIPNENWPTPAIKLRG